MYAVFTSGRRISWVFFLNFLSRALWARQTFPFPFFFYDAHAFTVYDLRPAHRDVCGRRAVRLGRSRTACTCARATWTRRAASTTVRIAGTCRCPSIRAATTSGSAADRARPLLRARQRQHTHTHTQLNDQVNTVVKGLHQVPQSLEKKTHVENK